mgnify:CR=1 FL=1
MDVLQCPPMLRTLLDERYEPPKPEVHFRWTAAQDKALRLAEGEPELRFYRLHL